jgi:hypothetical protein
MAHKVENNSFQSKDFFRIRSFPEIRCLAGPTMESWFRHLRQNLDSPDFEITRISFLIPLKGFTSSETLKAIRRSNHEGISGSPLIRELFPITPWEKCIERPFVLAPRDEE